MQLECRKCNAPKKGACSSGHAASPRNGLICRQHLRPSRPTQITRLSRVPWQICLVLWLLMDCHFGFQRIALHWMVHTQAKTLHGSKRQQTTPLESLFGAYLTSSVAILQFLAPLNQFRFHSSSTIGDPMQCNFS